ncbi:hypothetical protein RSAG8_11957, partial [Rhizoctonia solani AG-8 WAC10335]
MCNGTTCALCDPFASVCYHSCDKSSRCYGANSTPIPDKDKRGAVEVQIWSFLGCAGRGWMQCTALRRCSV